MRRIIRRAARHGHQLGCQQAFFYKLVSTLDDLMGEAYPEMRKQKNHVARVLQKEEERFAETLEQGMRILEDAIDAMQGDTISGDMVFKLYDTYGFPVDLTADVARERGLMIDQVGFDNEMEAQKTRARSSSQFNAVGDSFKLDEYPATRFLGYDESASQAKVIAILQNEKSLEVLDNNDEAMVILDRTPFYAESGGQVGDTGALGRENTEFQVRDTQKQNEIYLHIGRLSKGELAVGDTIDARIDEEYRDAVVLNHSGTHLMHAALRQILGDHVQQKGSLVDAEKLRFDFSHYQPLTRQEIEQIETRVNDEIRGNLPTSAETMDMEAAKTSGALALFGEKYGDIVRVLRIGSQSVELCGGTHVQRAGDIGLFKIVLENGIASGVRRIESVTGKKAMRRFIESDNRIDAAAQVLKSGRDDLVSRVEQLYASNRLLEKELATLKSRTASREGGDLAAQAVEIKGI